MKRFAMGLIVLLLSMTLAACGMPTDEGLLFHTADPSFDVLVRLPNSAPVVVPSEEVGEVAPEPLPAPPCDLIKGNISTRTGERIYHVPNGVSYSQVKIDEAAGERWFCSEDEAIDAGFRKASR